MSFKTLFASVPRGMIKSTMGYGNVGYGNVGYGNVPGQSNKKAFLYSKDIGLQCSLYLKFKHTQSKNSK
jgi:hypothetical protein